MASTQERISQNQELLAKTRDRIKQIKFNRDKEILLKQYEKDFKNVAGTVLNTYL